MHTRIRDSNRAEGETPEAFAARAAHIEAAVAGGSDPTRMIFQTAGNADEPGADPGGFCSETLIEIDRTIAANAPRMTESDPSILPLFTLLLRILPGLSIIWKNRSHRDDVAEFCWARARVLVSSAGYVHWNALTTRLQSTWSDCPLDPEETRTEWEQKLQQAHVQSGWATPLAWTGLTELAKIDSATDIPAVPTWLRTIAVIEILKYARYLPDVQAVALYVRGTGDQVELDRRTTVLSDQPRLVSMVQQQFALKTSTPKTIFLTTLAARQALGMLKVDDLIPQLPCGRLPPHILHGAWSSVTRASESEGAFVLHSRQLVNVWRAMHGRVTPWQGEGTVALDYQWPAASSEAADSVALTQFQSAVPSAYTAGSAWEVFRAAFSNIDVSESDACAVGCLFDAPIAASICRGLGMFTDLLAMEYPNVVFQPAVPTPGESTNHGKSTISVGYGRILNLDLTRETRVSANDSGVIMRSVGESLLAHGTWVLGEFAVPFNSPGHILTQSNMQSLATGASVSHGRVLSNTPISLSLRHSIVINSKCCTFRPDMINRSLFFWLGQIDPDARADVAQYANIVNGGLSLRARLNMLALCQSTLFRQLVEAELRTPSKIGTFRFPVHLAIARALYRMRMPTATPDAVNHTITRMHSRQIDHIEMSEANGTVEDLYSDGRPSLRISGMLDRIDPQELDSLYAVLPSPTTTREFLASYMMVRGFAERDIADMVEDVTGRRIRIRAAAILRQLDADLIRRLPTSGESWVLPGIHGLNGYTIERPATTDSVCRFSLKRNPHAPTNIPPFQPPTHP